MFANRRITVAVTGGIAAYKCCELVRTLIRGGADVHVAMTEHATAFVGPVTFEALSGHPVALTEWAPGPQGSMPHIGLNQGCDLLIVMPATANILAKAARGIADDLVSSLIAARRQPILFVPAMNQHMWQNPATQRNVALLKEDGCFFAGPAKGFQACGDTGAGRMLEPADVADLIPGIWAEKPLAGQRVVITAGPTYEPIDDVRGITNRSSGRQGFDVARAARDAGADVTLIAGPVHLPTPAGVKRTDVVTAREMLEAVRNATAEAPADLFIGVAAVADWCVKTPVEGKIKKEDGRVPELAFDENPDIVRTVHEEHRARHIIGFAAEACDLEAYARKKLQRKGADMIVGNIAREALEGTDNTVLFVTKEGSTPFGPASKREVAAEIIRRAAAFND